jgi:acyl-CoA synthetase (NDP forming)/RimJ/RimL family protein N-acetyltransferase
LTRVFLRDGSVAEVRKVHNNPEDRSLLKKLFKNSSPESLYFRFFSAVHEVSDKLINNMLRNDGTNHLALLCMLGDKPLGLGSYHRTNENGAEVALLVNDQVHGKGIGTLLLEQLAEAAWSYGFRQFEAEVLPENYKMLKVFTSSGYEINKKYESGSVRLVLPLAHTERRRALHDLREKMATASSLAPLLHPKTVAVVGASRDPLRLGHILFRHILEGGFQGTVYPVNPNAHSIAAVRSYPTVESITEVIDLAILAVSADKLLAMVDDCIKAGVRSVLIISAGFSERDEHGANLELEVVRRLNEAGCRLIGPNSLGIMNRNAQVILNASFAPHYPSIGKVAIASQSGGLGIAILEYSARIGIGVSNFVGLGNKADVSSNDLLQYWEDDPDTDMIILYLESFGNPRKFSRIARRITKNKPILVVKSARTSAGWSVSESRSISWGIQDNMLEALFRQTGIIRLDSMQEVFDVAALISSSPLPQGNRVAIITNSAGGAVMAADALINRGFTLARPPIDLGYEGLGEAYRRELPVLLRDTNVDAILVLFIPIGLSKEESVSTAIIESIQEAGHDKKPVLANFLSPFDSPIRFIDAGIQQVPVYSFPEQAIYALSMAMEYVQYRNRQQGSTPDLAGSNSDLARTLVRSHLKGAHPWLAQEAAASVLTAMGIPVFADGHTHSEDSSLRQTISIKAELDPLFGTVIRIEKEHASQWDDRPPALQTIRILPLTDLDCQEMIANTLQHADLAPEVTQSLEELLLRISRLAEDVYEITKIELAIELKRDGFNIDKYRVGAQSRVL